MLTCDKCDEEVQSDAVVCPHCWSVLDEYRYGQQRRRKAIRIGLGVMLAIGLVAGIWWLVPQPANPSKARSAAWQNALPEKFVKPKFVEPKKDASVLGVGDKVFLGFEFENAIHAPVFASHEAMKISELDDDGQLIIGLIALDLFFEVQPNTEAIIQKIDGDGVQVFLLSGPFSGHAVWTRQKVIHKTRL